MQQIKLAIIDDEQLIREGLKIILETHPELTVVATGSNGQEALELCRKQEIDVVLMDIRMPEADGIKGTKWIKAEFPAIKVLILTTFKDQAYIHAALQEGAAGYLLKDSSQEAIYNGIKSVHSGNMVLHSEVSSSIMPLANGVETPTDVSIADLQLAYDLNEKEIDIIRLVSGGFSNKEIAQQLFLSEGTIKNNVSTILSKLALRDRTQLAIFAYKNQLIND